MFGSSSAFADTITVTSLTDNGQSGTLRWALARANTNGVVDFILFNVPSPYIIEPTSNLPPVGEQFLPTHVLGSSQPGYTGTPIVTIRGTLAGVSANGLTVGSASNRVQALVITAFTNNGVFVQGCEYNEIQGCHILGNGSYGVDIWSGRHNLIGGTTASNRNVISSNYYGVYIHGSLPEDNRVIGNYIGTDPAGSNAWPNDRGILISQGAQVIGGPAAGEGNVISGNINEGIFLQGEGGSNTVIRGNYIGTDASGARSVSNGLHGIHLNAVSHVTVGGTNAGDRNVISGNAFGSIEGCGVYIYCMGSDQARENMVAGNYIGTDATGLKAVSNRHYGIRVWNGASNTIAGNVVAANRLSGIYIYGYNAPVTGTVIRGNYIGTDRTGTNPLPNVGAGVLMELSREGTIGGTNVADGNVISGNGAGVDLLYTDRDVVENNLIGVGSDGVTPVPNNYYGVSIRSTGTTIRANVISANTWGGITVEGAGRGTVIRGNWIGTDKTRSRDLGNAMSGIQISGTSGNSIGGTNSGDGNVIAYNDQWGVIVSGPPAVSNSILGNKIYSNGFSGIDLGGDGVSANDTTDPDLGVNNTQNFPIVSVAWRGSTIITGRLNSVASRTYRLEFFSNDECDPTGNGEGQMFIACTNVTTDGSGNANFRYFNRGTLQKGKYVTATATDVLRNETSEFSPCVQVVPAPDTDGDGMPDFWETTYGLDPNVSNTPAADLDFDRVPDVQEYLADTAANDPTQYLCFGGIWNSQGPIIMFTTSVGRVYDLDYSTNMLSPQPWLFLSHDLDGIDGNLFVRDYNPIQSPCIYRVRARLP